MKKANEKLTYIVAKHVGPTGVTHAGYGCGSTRRVTYDPVVVIVVVLPWHFPQVFRRRHLRRAVVDALPSSSLCWHGPAAIVVIFVMLAWMRHRCLALAFAVGVSTSSFSSCWHGHTAVVVAAIFVDFWTRCHVGHGGGRRCVDAAAAGGSG